MPSYEAEYASFTGLDAQVLGISVDHVPCLKAWAESLGGINYPLLSDFWPHGAVAEKYGVFRSDGKSERAIFVIDKTGIIRYIDIHDIDEQPENDELRKVLREIDPQAAARAAVPKPTEKVDLPRGGIVMYCTKWCPACRRARHWFAERDLDFAEVDITITPEGAEQVKQWANGNRSTPTIDVDGTVIINWNEAALINVLKEKGYLV